MKKTSYRHWCVRWANDMLVDERHFRQEQAYVEGLFGWGLSQAWGTYGLVNIQDVEKNVKIGIEEIDYERRLIRLTLRICVGVTPDGLRVFVRGDLRDEYSLARDIVLERMDCRYDVLVRVDPLGDRKERFSYDSEVPLATPSYELIVEPHQQTRNLQGMVMKVAELESRGGKLENDEHYIPPCTGVRCNPILLSAAERFHTHFERIRRNSLKVALGHSMGEQGILHQGDGPDSITEVFEYLCNQLAIWLGGNIDQLQLAIKMNKPPTEIFVFTRQFFRLFDAILDAMGGTGRMQFYEKWNEWNVAFTKKALFEETLHHVLDRDYDHHNFRNYLEMVESLLGPFDEALEAVVHSGPQKSLKPLPEQKKQEKRGIIRQVEKSSSGWRRR